MPGCPYCGEVVQAEARICKHCQRPILYSVTLIESLNDKQKHIFFKNWQRLDKSKMKCLSIASYSTAKSDLDHIPLTLAWDLNCKEADRILQELNDSAFEKKNQGGMPSTYSNEEPSKETHWGSVFYGIAAVVLIALGSYVAWQSRHRANDRAPASQIPKIEDLSRLDEYRAIGSMQAPAVPAQNNGAALIPNNKENLEKSEVEQVLSATVFIRDPVKLGSGFLVTSDGYILTNAHVVSDMEKPIVILHDGRQYEAQKVREDRKLDVALIKIRESGLTYLKLGDANQLYQGQAVVAVGNPGGLSFTVTRGIVSYIGRNINGVPFIQTDAAINRGNSGGPMINSNLEVVGINSLTSTQEQGISFALPINFVCSNNGVAAEIATTPSSCASFISTADPIVTTSIEHAPHNPKSEGPMTNYTNEADEYRRALDRDEGEFKAEEARLKADIEAAKASQAADPNNVSLRDRITQKIAELQTQFDPINKKRAQAQLKFIEQMISLLQRQKVDSSYAAYLAQIEDQISKFETSRRQVKSFLNQ